MKVEVEGLDNILSNIKKFEKDALKKSEGVARKVAKDVVMPVLVRNTPYDSQSKNPEHLRDEVYVSMRKVKGEGYKRAKVDYRKKVRYRAYFVEWGTIHQRAQNFSAKTAVSVKRTVEREIARQLRSIV